MHDTAVLILSFVVLSVFMAQYYLRGEDNNGQFIEFVLRMVLIILHLVVAQSNHRPNFQALMKY